MTCSSKTDTIFGIGNSKLVSNMLDFIQIRCRVVFCPMMHVRKHFTEFWNLVSFYFWNQRNTSVDTSNKMHGCWFSGMCFDINLALKSKANEVTFKIQKWNLLLGSGEVVSGVLAAVVSTRSLDHTDRPSVCTTVENCSVSLPADRPPLLHDTFEVLLRWMKSN